MQNAVLNAIAQRRSIRAYQPQQIEEEQLQTLLQAGQQAPSASNKQPWHFTAVQNKALISEINEQFRVEMLKVCTEDKRPAFENPDYSVFYHAPTVLFFSCPAISAMRYAETDTGMAIENMALAAHSMGLGTVILGMPRLVFMREDAAETRQKLGFPEGFDFCLALAVGYPAMTKEAHPQEPDRITIIR